MANDWRTTVDEVLALQAIDGIDTSPAPGFQWFPQQWLGDAAVLLMSWRARGIHHHLLMIAWKGFDLDEDAVPCSLPDDEGMLKALCQQPAEWADLWPQVKRGWKARKDRLWNIGLCRSYLRQMKTRRVRKAAADARWGREQCKTDANASNQDANASVLHCSSSSSSLTGSMQEKIPPTPQGETRPASRKPRPKGRKIPNVTIPDELAAIGIDAASFALRVKATKTKPATAWQKELDRLVPMVAEAGAGAVMETWEDATGGSWQGCTPAMVRDKARRNATGQRFNHENAAGGRRPDNDDDVGC